MSSVFSKVDVKDESDYPMKGEEGSKIVVAKPDVETILAGVASVDTSGELALTPFESNPTGYLAVSKAIIQLLSSRHASDSVTSDALVALLGSLDRIEKLLLQQATHQSELIHHLLAANEHIGYLACERDVLSARVHELEGSAGKSLPIYVNIENVQGQSLTLEDMSRAEVVTRKDETCKSVIDVTW
ncbi:hypothetical protein M427DRAFT_136082 [Gonapodya prolifera JEL478]|uniref:Uncharacterized protein n=1 Tax=Gonapodya prolifera (strain JEL478) TaxID=1344416 RepID=A0A139ABH4_GONPJ|nr:hypothetical protein M427DRAFT_136082 [Gonapodya prolifera JEL478]|eukprot:KXS13994.1 hypothetical protein M427DRAFT_136082 [Gonapodya prolifera JEL478]